MTFALPIVCLVLGLGVGAVCTWLVLRAKCSQALVEARSQGESELARMSERWEQESSRRSELEAQLEVRQDEATAHQQQIAKLREEQACLSTTLAQERRQASEKLELLDDARAKFADVFKATASDALNKNSQSFLRLAQTKLEKYQEVAKGDLEKRQQSINEVLRPVRESLKLVDQKLGDVEKSRIEAYSKLTTEVKSLAQTQTELRGETARLVKALRRPEVRGRWGEIQLRRVVELAGMVEHCDFFEQAHLETDDGALRPDLVVRLPGAKSIVVDSKAPITAYLDAVDSEDDELHVDRLTSHAQHIRTHVRSLAKKGYHQHLDNSPEFVVLFLPIEACLSAALSCDPELIEFAAQQNVIVATPTTLISLLRAVYYGWRQQQLAENAKQISELGHELYRRISTFGDHVAKLGKSLTSATKHYNSAVGSLERNVLSQARKFQELGATPAGAELVQLPGIEETSRVLTAPELVASDAPTETDSPVVAHIDEQRRTVSEVPRREAL